MVLNSRPRFRCVLVCGVHEIHTMKPIEFLAQFWRSHAEKKVEPAGRFYGGVKSILQVRCHKKHDLSLVVKPCEFRKHCGRQKLASDIKMDLAFTCLHKSVHLIKKYNHAC